ncbi:MAG TPA: anhydro-N-acetylmuramic acid kinase [Bryobacteraceae bacterium]|nr:anhydro-N-acetylmuramic acid kinase [Bryobacteraceae bacterium]
MRVAGLISGTSVDGIDVAVVDITDTDLHLVKAATATWPPEMRARILGISNAPTHTADIAEMNFLVGRHFASALVEAFPVESIELIGSHGQTIYHHGSDPLCTLQIGEGAVIAEMTGRPVVSDFRVADMAAGGRGAPLVPFLDYRLFRHDSIHRIALNIGGIANITVIPAGARPEDVVAFDTGPGNMIIDALTPPFDRDGAQARAGRVNEWLLEEILRDSYYQQPPPKTAGREQYGAAFIERTGIDVATATELTVRTIAAAVAAFPATQEVIVSGGGAHNTYMMERLQASIRPRLRRSAELGVDIDAKEAILFALLAYETWHRRPGNIPSATGAAHPAILGKMSRPSPP